MSYGLHIGGEWKQAQGEEIQSRNPADNSILWQANSAKPSDVDLAVKSARKAFNGWSRLSFEDRLQYIDKFCEMVKKNSDELARTISEETGKPLWDAQGEVKAVLGKRDISVQAYHERTGSMVDSKFGIDMRMKHKPHGVLAVFGPYNFPCHLPNGHILPALLAGNTLVFKPSEQTPLSAELMVEYWTEAGLPNGVLNLVQGAKETGIALASNDDIDGVLFTGSVTTGRILHKQFGGQPEKILALEMGGNNPLIVERVESIKEAVLTTIQSAYISSGQRCTCARRLIVPQGEWGDEFIRVLIKYVSAIRIGSYEDDQTPFMGPLISEQAANTVIHQQQKLIEAGAKSLLPVERMDRSSAFVTPGLLDVSSIQDDLFDEEVFGPLLQIMRSRDFSHAIQLANQTRFGLSAGLLSDQLDQYEKFSTEIRAGIINWNRPLTGASSAMPFGGVGQSGNHRPSAYYAADYCAYPVASLISDTIKKDSSLLDFIDTTKLA